MILPFVDVVRIYFMYELQLLSNMPSNGNNSCILFKFIMWKTCHGNSFCPDIIFHLPFQYHEIYA